MIAKKKKSKNPGDNFPVSTHNNDSFPIGILDGKSNIGLEQSPIPTLTQGTPTNAGAIITSSAPLTFIDDSAIACASAEIPFNASECKGFDA